MWNMVRCGEGSFDERLVEVVRQKSKRRARDMGMQGWRAGVAAAARVRGTGQVPVLKNCLPGIKPAVGSSDWPPVAAPSISLDQIQSIQVSLKDHRPSPRARQPQAPRTPSSASLKTATIFRQASHDPPPITNYQPQQPYPASHHGRLR